MVKNSKNDKRADALRTNLKRRKKQEKSLKQATDIPVPNKQTTSLSTDTKNKDA